MHPDTSGRPGAPDPDPATNHPSGERDDSRRTTPVTDLQADDATAADTGEAPVASPSAPLPDRRRPGSDSSGDRASRAMKQEHKTPQGR